MWTIILTKCHNQIEELVKVTDIQYTNQVVTSNKSETVQDRAMFYYRVLTGSRVCSITINNWHNC